MSDPSVVKTVRAYYLWFGSYLILFHFGLWGYLEWRSRRPLPSGSPMQKAEYYRRHASDFDVIFLGDSRTYCGLHPSEIDPLLGTRSYNLSIFAHWFPTQYPAIADLVADIPPSTTVVWSIGSGNFDPIGADRQIRDAYPVGFANVSRYLTWGYRWRELSPNLVRFATHHWPVVLLAKLQAWGQIPVIRWTSSEKQSANSISAGMHNDRVEKELAELLLRLRADPLVSTIEILRDPQTNNVTSVAVVNRDGAYCRYELDREFFRRQQAAHITELAQQHANKRDDPSYQPDPAYWQTFLAILDLFERHHVRVIVNAIPEAPYVYRNKAAARAERAFINRDAREAVEAHGFRWVAAETASLVDADYFDYNHLNHEGIERYSRRMSDALAPYIHPKSNERRN